LDLKGLLASTGRQKILKVLSEYREIHIMELVRKVCGRYNEVNRNLNILEAEGIIMTYYQKQVKHPKFRIVRLIRENRRTQILLKALKDLGDEKR
jgi:predicted transcriptional regulator